MDRLRREFQQLGTLQSPDACRQAPRVSTRAQDAIPDSQRTLVVTENLFQDFSRLFQSRLFFPLRFLVSETSHTSVYYFVYPVSPILTSVSQWYPLELGWIQCDITEHTVLLYVLFCLTYMYCTYTYCTLYT